MPAYLRPWYTLSSPTKQEEKAIHHMHTEHYHAAESPQQMGYRSEKTDRRRVKHATRPQTRTRPCRARNERVTQTHHEQNKSEDTTAPRHLNIASFD